MFHSTYIPVNMHRVNCAIYSAEKVFPEERLVKAYSYITGHDVEGVSMVEGNVVFTDGSEFIWTIPEIYLAYEAYQTAAKNNFSYYMVKDSADIPQLFVSKAFQSHRIIVNAFTMQSILLTNKTLVTRAASIIDKVLPSTVCLEMFRIMEKIERGSAKFLPALILDKGTEDECMVVSPITTTASDITTMFSLDVINSLREVYQNHEIENEHVRMANNKFEVYSHAHWPLLSKDIVEFVLSTYDKILEKKSSYLGITGEDYYPGLYFSTNHRYLVNATTFECVVVKNQNLKNSLIEMTKADCVSASEMHMVWSLACESAYGKKGE